MEVSSELHAPAALPPGMNFGAYLIGGWMAPKDCLGGIGKEKNPYHNRVFNSGSSSP